MFRCRVQRLDVDDTKLRDDGPPPYSKKSFPLKAATPPASGHNGVSSLAINNTLDGGPRFGLEYDIAVPLLRDC